MTGTKTASKETAEDVAYVIATAAAFASAASLTCIVTRRLDPKSLFGFTFAFVSTSALGLRFEEEIGILFRRYRRILRKLAEEVNSFDVP